MTYALHSEKDRRLKEKVITAAYTMLDTKRTASDDDFFRVPRARGEVPVLRRLRDLRQGGRRRDGAPAKTRTSPSSS